MGNTQIADHSEHEKCAPQKKWREKKREGKAREKASRAAVTVTLPPELEFIKPPHKCECFR